MARLAVIMLGYQLRLQLRVHIMLSAHNNIRGVKKYFFLKVDGGAKIVSLSYYNLQHPSSTANIRQ
jgi:hypothetical protein